MCVCVPMRLQAQRQHVVPLVAVSNGSSSEHVHCRATPNTRGCRRQRYVCLLSRTYATYLCVCAAVVASASTNEAITT